jgi:hypothetical protein
MGQFSVKTYNPPGSLLSATQQWNHRNNFLVLTMDTFVPTGRYKRTDLANIGTNVCENGGAIFDHGSGGIVLLRAA